MNYRKLSVVLLLLAGITTGVASGAFTTATAERTASITAAGDDSALLAIEPHSSADPKDAFFSGGSFEISVNPTSTTLFDKLFTVTNQGTQPVGVWIADIDHDLNQSYSGDVFGGLDEDNTASITFFNSTYGGSANCENNVESIETQSNAVELDPGETLVVSLQANSSDVDQDEADLLDQITINADASVTGQTSSTNNPC